MPSNQFSQITVVESLSASELHTGRKLFEDIEALNNTLGHSLKIECIDAPDAASFWLCLSNVYQAAAAGGHYPILHIECHGDETQSGLVLADQSFISWTELKPILTEINVASRCNLLIVLGLCHGAHLVQIVKPTERAPCWGLLGPWGTVRASDLLSGFAAYYRELLTSLDGDRALAALSTASPSSQHQFISAQGFFKRTYAAYLANYSSTSGLDRRAKTISRKLHDLGSTARPGKGAIKRRLRQTEKPSFQRYADHFFMVDLFPENAGRFSVSFSEVEAMSSRPPHRGR